MNVAYNGEPDFSSHEASVRGTTELQSEKVSETGSWRNRKTEIRSPKRNPKAEIRKIQQFAISFDFGFRIFVGLSSQHALTKLAIGGFLGKCSGKDLKRGTPG